HYLQYSGVATSEDPLLGIREGVVVDPDRDDFQLQLQSLATIYSANFELEDLPTPMDNVNGEPAQIDWKQNYYIMGLPAHVLTQNTWLEQTIGWLDASGGQGTF